MTEKPFALSLRLQPSPYLVPFDLVVQLLPKELDEVVRSKIDVLDANRVIAFGLAFPSPRNLNGAFQAWLTRSRVYTAPDPVCPGDLPEKGLS